MNIFEHLKKKIAIDLTDIDVGEHIIKCVDKNTLILVTISRCVEKNGKLITFEDQRILYVNKDNYQERMPTITFNKRKYYPDFMFYRVDKDIAPECFL